MNRAGIRAVREFTAKLYDSLVTVGLAVIVVAIWIAAFTATVTP